MWDKWALGTCGNWHKSTEMGTMGQMGNLGPMMGGKMGTQGK